MSVPDCRNAAAVAASQAGPRRAAAPHAGISASASRASLAFQVSSPMMASHRLGEHPVALQPGQADPLHDRVLVLEAVAERGRPRVHARSGRAAGPCRVTRIVSCFWMLTSIGASARSACPSARQDDHERLVVLGDGDAHQAALAPGLLGHPRPEVVVHIGIDRSPA